MQLGSVPGLGAGPAGVQVPTRGNQPLMTAVLIIEDEIRLARHIQTYLSRFGFDVRQSHSGEDGLKNFKRSRSDIVLLDLGLPDMDGLEVLRKLRSLDDQVQIIVMSATMVSKNETVARKAGARDCLAKPLALKDLRQLLEKAAT